MAFRFRQKKILMLHQLKKKSCMAMRRKKVVIGKVEVEVIGEEEEEVR